MPQVSQVRPDRSEPVLEAQQSFVVEIGSTEIKFYNLFGLTFLNQPPEQERHSSEMMILFV